MTKDTTWIIAKRETLVPVTPLRFDSQIEAQKWVDRNQPLYPEEIQPLLVFLSTKEVIQEDHDAFIRSVTGKNALSYK